jgi:hypothetical protein
MAVTVEAVWEIVENTNTVIEAYRESTIALNYVGDSIGNSLGDVAAFALGPRTRNRATPSRWYG